MVAVFAALPRRPPAQMLVVVTLPVAKDDVIVVEATMLPTSPPELQLFPVTMADDEDPVIADPVA